ncbi:MAG: hypothetical protein U0W40_17180 [Acidimicrobiia bacterium]
MTSAAPQPEAAGPERTGCLRGLSTALIWIVAVFFIAATIPMFIFATVLSSTVFWVLTILFGSVAIACIVLGAVISWPRR